MLCYNDLLSKQEAKSNLNVGWPQCGYFILRKENLNNIFMFFEDLLPHNIPRP